MPIIGIGILFAVAINVLLQYGAAHTGFVFIYSLIFLIAALTTKFSPLLNTVLLISLTILGCVIFGSSMIFGIIACMFIVGAICALL